MGLVFARLHKVAISSVCITLMVLPTVNASASIPDNIDVGKHRKIYETAKQDSDNKRSIAQGILRDIEVVVDEISDLENSIIRNERQISNNVSEIRSLRNLNSNMRQESSRMEQDIDENIREIEANRRMMVSLGRELDQAEQELQGLKQRRQRVRQNKEKVSQNNSKITERFSKQKNRLKLLRTKKSNLTQAIQKNQQAVEKLTQRIQALKTEKQNKSAQIPKLQTQIGNIQKQNVNLNAQVKQLQQKITTLVDKRKVSTEKNAKLRNQIVVKRKKIAELKKGTDPKKAQKIANLQTQIKNHNAQIAKLVEQRKNISIQITNNKKAIQNKRAKIQSNNKSLAQKQKQIAAHKNRVNQIGPLIVKSKTARTTHANKIPALKQQRVAVQANINKVKTNFEKTKQEKLAVEQRLAKIAERLALIRKKVKNKKLLISRLDGRISRLQAENSSLRNSNRRLTGQIEDNRDQIRRNRNSIALLQDENGRLDERIAQLNEEVRLKSREETTLRAEYTIADDTAKSAEAFTLVKKRIYIAVKAQYDREYLAAKNSGASQGSPLGNSAGDEPGTIAGTKAGTAEGNNFGNQEGLLVGYLNGLEDGLTEGKKEGYEHGLTLPGNFDRGYKIGYDQGILNAKAIARRENYFPTRAKRKAELLRKVLSNSVELDNKTARGSLSLMAENGRLPAADGLIQVMNQGSPSSGNLIPISSFTGNTWDDLTALMDRVKANIDAIPDGAIINDNTGVVTFPIPVDMNQASCNQRYIDFVNACLASFSSAYKQAFKSSYKSSFQSAKIVAFDLEKPKAFAKVETQRHGEGHKHAYDIAYATWDAIGAEEAENKGLSAGLKDGEANTIEQARKTATENGINDENKFFATNPVLRLKSVSFIKAKDGKKTEVIAGDEILLSAVVSNFGALASQKGQSKIKWESITNNVVVDETLHPLVGIPGETKASVKSIAYAKVSRDAVLAQVVKLKVTIYQPDGEVESQIVQFTTKQHLNTSIDVDMDTMVERSGGIYFALVKISNDSNVDSPRDLEAKMTFPNGSGFKGKVTSANFGKIKAGTTVTRMFKYKTRKAKVKSTVPVTITVYFAGQISAQKVYKVKVVREICDESDPFCF